MQSDRRSKAAAVLARVAKKVNSPRLSAIATRVRLDAFVKVKKAIDDMVAQLTQEKADEIKHKDFCVEEFNSNQLATENKTREKENKEFQMTVADQRATQKLLQAALEILKGFYDKKNTTFDKVGLLQKGKQQPPMTGFKDYSKNKQAGGVQGMIQTIIDDAK